MNATPADTGLAPPMLPDVRVLDLTETIGAYGTRLLAGFGAEVILVEPPEGARRRTRPVRYELVPTPPSVPGLHFLHYDSGKRSVTIDVESERGRDTFLRLCETADIVVDNGHLARWGFDLDEMTAGRPLVILSITPFGLDGSRTHWLGGDLIAQAMSGMINLYGYRDERPMRYGREQASQMGGLLVALGSLIALYGARADGVGEVVDLPLERACALVSLQYPTSSLHHQFGLNAVRAPRDGEREERVYRAKDGFVSLRTSRFPRKTADLLDHIGGDGDALRQILDAKGDQEGIAAPEADEIVMAAVFGAAKSVIVETAQGMSVMSLPVQDAADVANDPWLRDRAFFVEVEHPEIGQTFQDGGLPYLVNGRRLRASVRPPLLGEHNDVVLGALTQKVR